MHGLINLVVEIERFRHVHLAIFGQPPVALSWRHKRTVRAAVRVEIEKMLDCGLPGKYSNELSETKCAALFQHVREKYAERGDSIYNAAG